MGDKPYKLSADLAELKRLIAEFSSDDDEIKERLCRRSATGRELAMIEAEMALADATNTYHSSRARLLRVRKALLLAPKPETAQTEEKSPL